MSRNLSELIAAERALLNNQAWLVAAMKKIKTHRISLQVERLQLQSMLNKREENGQSQEVHLKQDNFDAKLTKAPPIESINTNSSDSTVIPPIEQLDQAESSYNRQTLNLSIMNDIDTILSGTYCGESNLEEVESSDEEW